MSTDKEEETPLTEPKRDSDEILIGYYVLLYIDILNQKEKLAETARLPQNEEETAKFIESLRATSGVVEAFRKLFDTYFDSFADDEISGLDFVSEAERKFIQLCKRVEIKKQCFSDTMIYYAWVMEEPDRLVISAIDSLLSAAAGGFLLTLSNGLICRGAIEIGTAREFSSGDLYGYAMYQAHKLESEIAQYPRIVVGNLLLEFIGNELAVPGESPIEQYRRDTAERCKGWLLRDIDGVNIIDYAGKQSKEVFKVLNDAIDPAIAFVQGEWQKFRNQGARNPLAQKLATRYYLMLQYLLNRKQTIWK